MQPLHFFLIHLTLAFASYFGRKNSSENEYPCWHVPGSSQFCHFDANVVRLLRSASAGLGVPVATSIVLQDAASPNSQCVGAAHALRASSIVQLSLSLGCSFLTPPAEPAGGCNYCHIGRCFIDFREVDCWLTMSESHGAPDRPGRITVGGPRNAGPARSWRLQAPDWRPFFSR